MTLLPTTFVSYNAKWWWRSGAPEPRGSNTRCEHEDGHGWKQRRAMDLLDENDSRSVQERGSNDPEEGGSVPSNQDDNDDGRCEKQTEADDKSAQSGTGKPGDADHSPDHSATGRQKENLKNQGLYIAWVISFIITGKLNALLQKG